MKRNEIIIYPNNTSCLNGRLLGMNATADLLREHEIDPERPYDAVYNTPAGRIVAFGNAAPPQTIIAERQMRRAECQRREARQLTLFQ